MRLELADERGRVAAAVDGAATAARAPRGSPAAIASKRAEEELGVGDPEHGKHVGEGDLVPRVGVQLLEGAQRVAEAAGGVAGDDGHRLGPDRDRLGGGDARETVAI